MITKRVEIERLSVISPKPFEAVLEGLKAAIGNLDMSQFSRAIKTARTFSEFEDVVREAWERRD